MEELFDQLCKESNSSKYLSIKEGCLEVKGILECQSNLMHYPPSDLRAICLKPLQMALETKQSKLVTLAVSGFQKLLRDNQFYASYEDPDESTWLTCQLLSATQSLPSHSEDVQVELLKVILNMSCIPAISMSGHILVHILGVCGSAYGRGNPAMRLASQSAASQSIVTFLSQLMSESDEQAKRMEKSHHGPTPSSEEEEELGIYDFVAPAFDELVSIINYIAEKLTEANKHRECKKEVEVPTLFLLECTNSLLVGLSNSNTESCSTSMYCQSVSEDKAVCRPPAYCSTLLVSALWQRLCPALIALLGTPVSMRVSRGCGRTQGQLGRGSGTASLPSLFFNSQEAKAIYSVACNLVVAMGSVGEMRPVLESLFHRMLLYPPPICREDALKAVSEVMKHPSKLIQLAGPILHCDPRNHYQCDLTLFRLTMDSLIECSNLSDVGMQMAVMDCIAGLLSSLELLCEGKNLSLLHTATINDTFPRLEDVDYMGPLTYENHHVTSKYEDCPDSLTSDSESEVPDTRSQPSVKEKDEDEISAEKKEENKTNEVLEEKDGKSEDSLKAVPGTKEADVREKKLEGSESDFESDSSGDTEGPVDEVLLSEQQMLADEEDMRLLRLLESLEPKTDKTVTLKDEEEEREIANAVHFCVTIQALLPSLLAIRSTIEVDEAVLQFSSKYCQGVFSYTSDNRGCPIIINADGIYLVTYAALSLNLKLIQKSYYCKNDETCLPLTQDQFVDSVFGSGVLIYLSSSWVAEVYNQVIKDSFLQRAGYNPQSPSNCALINLLSDFDGLGSNEKGSQMLSDHRRLERAAPTLPRSSSKDAGYKLCRRILTCCWESVVSILETLLKHLEGEGGFLAPIRLLLLGENLRKDEARREQDTLILCLSSLQSTARLANTLGLQKRCGVVFSLLSSACLPKDERNPVVTFRKNRFRSPSFPRKPLKKLHKAHVLSFHVMMSSGLELGSHASDCWTHLFRCCLYLAELERKFFSGSNPTVPFRGFTTAPLNEATKRETRLSASSDDFCSEDLPASFSFTSEITSLSIEELVSECQEEASSTGFLSTQLSGKAICCLTLLVDKFFDHASSQLNLNALISFLKELCQTSQFQLFSRVDPCTPKKKLINWSRLKSPARVLEGGIAEESLLLHRLGEVMLKVVRSGRPLIHVMKAWAVAGPHFLEAACHKDGIVSKKAVCCIHDVVNSLLGSQTELPHFHFNEALFKPFENLLCLELCDIEVQDQIVSSICEFVETCNSEIKSGWRPLFGALRCVRAVSMVLPSSLANTKEVCHESVSHLRAVKDVFEAFLATDNVLVFANAALDCILCLLKHVKGQGDGEPVTETVMCWGELVGGDLCLDALRYIHRCSVILASMHVMPATPVFHAVHRINLSSSEHVVDWKIPGICEASFWTLIEETLNSEKGKMERVDYSPLWPEKVDGGSISLQSLDEGSGLLQVWYVLLEGLAGAVITCPRRYQPQVLDTLFSLMRALPECPGPSFGLYCINHLLLPLMQEWIRRSNSAQNPDWECAQSFKQYTGLTSDLVVEYLHRSSSNGNLENAAARRLMLQQTLIVLVECVNCSSEAISRLGCSCIRHIAISCGDKMVPSMWDILVRALHRASQVSLYPLYQLMNMFCPESPNFYGDIGQVKVAARRDCAGHDTDRLRQISHQVFLLDSQRHKLASVEENPEAEDRSFIFLLYSPASSLEANEDGLGGELVPARVPFRSLVVGLLANQMILQTLGQLLVEGSPHVVPSLANVLLQTSDFSRHPSSDGVGEIKGSLPGMLKWLTQDQIMVLLNTLKLSYETSVHFDRRPGLKFLIQKVAQSERAANLYKQAGASWTLRMLTLFDLILSKVSCGLDLEKVKSVLDSERIDTSDQKLMTPQHRSLDRPSTLMGGDTLLYIRMLSETFTELCEAYLELVAMRVHDKGSPCDLVDDQPIFFLTLPADDFPTSHRKNLEKWTKGLEEFNKDYISGGSHSWRTSDPRNEGSEETPSNECSSFSSLPPKMTLGASATHVDESGELGDDHPLASPSEKKSFSFADLAQALNSDEETEDDSSSCTKGDSGVASGMCMDQSVYSIATEKDISALMGDYRRRKGRHSLPSHCGGQKRVNPFTAEALQQQHQSFRPSESVPPEIEEQRSSSLLKDSEAHLKVWTEMVVSVFDLISQLKDVELRPLLPLVFPTMRSLTAHAHDPHLRQVVAEMLNRVARLYGFSPAD